MRVILAIAVSLIATEAAQAQAGSAIPVTTDNFARAESDLYMAMRSRTAASVTFTTIARPQKSIVNLSSA